MEPSSYLKMGPLVVKGSLLLALTLVALVALKLALSDCNFLNRHACNEKALQDKKLTNEINELRARAATLKDDISKIECKPESAPVEAPVIETPVKDIPIDETLWNEGKIEALSGCWVLDWDYKMTVVGTGRVVGVKKWRVCFNAKGNTGIQNLDFDDGVKCINQPIKGSFLTTNNRSTLTLDDTKDVECSNAHIIRRQLKCELAKDSSYAMCASRTLGSNDIWDDYKKNAVRLKRSNK